MAVELRLAIEAAGSDCRLFGDGVTVVIDDVHGYGPDAAVQCGGTLELPPTGPVLDLDACFAVLAEAG